MEISPVVCWLVAGLLLVGVDMLLGTFYLLVMGLAAGCGALAAWSGLSAGWQFSVFAVATIVGSLIVQRFRSANSSESDALQQPDVVRPSRLRNGTTTVRRRFPTEALCGPRTPSNSPSVRSAFGVLCESRARGC